MCVSEEGCRSAVNEKQHICINVENQMFVLRENAQILWFHLFKGENELVSFFHGL